MSQLIRAIVVAVTLVLAPVSLARGACPDAFTDREFLLKIETYSDLTFLSRTGEFRLRYTNAKGKTVQHFLAFPETGGEKSTVLIDYPHAQSAEDIYDRFFKAHDPNGELEISFLSRRHLTEWERSRSISTPLYLKITGDKELLLNVFKSPAPLYYLDWSRLPAPTE
jgi:hypothetical protein